MQCSMTWRIKRPRLSAIAPTIIGASVMMLSVLWLWYFVPPVPKVAVYTVVYFEHGKTKKGHPIMEAKTRRELHYVLPDVRTQRRMEEGRLGPRPNGS